MGFTLKMRIFGFIMSRILKVRNVNDYARYLGSPEQHPLVCVVDYAEVSPIRHSLNNYSVYGLFLRDDADVELEYGCGKYDYNKGTLLCVAPGQIGGKEDNGERMYITGWALPVPSRPTPRLSARTAHQELLVFRLPGERGPAHDR